MFEDYYFDDQQLQGLLDAIGYSTPSAEPIMYGDPMAGATPIMDTYQQAAVEPMTQEAAPAEAPFDLSKLDFSGIDLSGLNSLYGMNFASNFGGGAMGGIYPNDPNLQYINAPTSNKGNPTSPSGNVFTMTPDQPVRLVDLRTNEVVFEGTGYDAAREATRLGQNLTDTLGRKAEYNIQTANPSGEYTTVANEKKNKSTLGEIANVVGTVAPLALSFVPGFGQLSLLAKVASAAGAGGLGAALKGDDILKGALLGGATAGIASGTGLDKALGGVLGNVGSSAAQAGGQAAGQAAGDIVVTGLSKGLQAAGGALGQAALSQAAKAGLSEVTGYKTPAEQFSQQPLPEAFQPPVDMYAGIKPIDVLANRAASGSGSAFGASFPIPVDAMLSGVLAAAQPAAAQPAAAQPETVQPVTEGPGTIVTGIGTESLTPDEILAALGGAGALATAAATAGGGAGASSNVVDGVDQANGDIVVSKAQPYLSPEALASVIASGAPTSLLPDNFFEPPSDNKFDFKDVLGTGLNLPQLLSLGGVGADLLKSLLAGGGGDTGAGVPYVSPFGTGAGFAPRQDMRANPNITDYERYGFGPEAMFFQPQYTGLLPASTPAPQAPAGMSINPALMPLF
jgi:hypothetical protein